MSKAILEMELPQGCDNCILNVMMCHEESSNWYNQCILLDREVEYLKGSVRFDDCPLVIVGGKEE